MGHHLSLEVVDQVITIKCTCGYFEVIGHQCTVGLVVALSQAHKAKYLIKSMEVLGVKDEDHT